MPIDFSKLARKRKRDLTFTYRCACGVESECWIRLPPHLVEADCAGTYPTRLEDRSVCRGPQTLIRVFDNETNLDVPATDWGRDLDFVEVQDG